MGRVKAVGERMEKMGMNETELRLGKGEKGTTRVRGEWNNF